MKKIYFLLFIVVNVSIVYCQNKQIDDPKNKWVPNQIIVKFKDSYQLNNRSMEVGKTATSVAFDAFASDNKIKKIERVFLQDGFFVRRAKMHGVAKKFENLTTVTIAKDSVNMTEMIKQFQAMPEVEYAEPNYIFSTGNTTKPNPVQLVSLIEEKQNFLTNVRIDNTKIKSAFIPPAPTVTPSDPLFGQQLNLQLINAQKAWEVTKGDSSIVVAVLDTGIDWQHPDLAQNIWTNKKELNGTAGADDDNNGYVDDIRGWDFVNNDNNPMDDNSHGTHVAGIIAARGDNGIGITGINWYAKIMCIKVMQSTGRGDAATIAKGVEYAAANGANIINLSLGGYYESLTLKAALENAYANCFIVAAAGNDGTAIGPCMGCAPLYPGAYSFVMGVQDQASYSNYDQDGPFVSKYPNLLNYDVFAPGSSVTSTIPNGAYAAYTGTSMSTPLVAGIASLYMTKYPKYDKEFLFGHLVNNSLGGFIDAYKVLTDQGKPNITITKTDIVDTCSTCNNDGYPDAGENVTLRFYIKNTWAPADSVSIKLNYEGLADTSLVQFIRDSSYVGAISPNASAFTQLPLIVHISDKVYHGADYKIKATIKDNMGNSWQQIVVITFHNAITFGGILTNDVTLYPNKYYYVVDNLLVQDCNMIIKPGSTLNFSDGKALRTVGTGTIQALGKRDSVITFTSNTRWQGLNLNYGQYPNGIAFKDYDYFIDTVKNTSKFKYCVFEAIDNYLGGIQGGSLITRSVYRGSYSQPYAGFFFRNNVINNFGVSGDMRLESSDYCNYIDNVSGMFMWGNFGDKRNNVLNSSGGIDLREFVGTGISNIPKYIYFGTTDSALLENHIYDFFDYSNYNAINIKGFKTTPCDSCPGMVWKLTLDGKEMSSNTINPEDILELGTHEIKVWFNTQMDTAYTPTISFGQRDPFNQNFIKNKGVWSTDGKTYTISRDFVLTDPKGIVNFAVSGAKDTLGLEIPYERTRFRVNLQSTGSKSLDFSLVPQCGKLQLNWENLRTPGSDIIGYNIYRRNKTSNGAFGLLNNTLILDNAYKDYKVGLDTTYDYVYTAVRDGMNNETDSSFILTGKPLPSKLGDADGDSAVNVTDVVAAVNYILQKNPNAFIFKQADINNDKVINVLDIIGIIDRILNPRIGGYNGTYDYNPTSSPGKLFLYNQNDTLFARTVFKIGGIESSTNNTVSKWIGDLSKWETVKTPAGKIMQYSFGGSLELPDALPIAIINSKVNPSEWIISTDDGRPLEIVWLGKIANNIKKQSENVYLSDASPNPAKDVLHYTAEIKTAVNNFSCVLTDISGKELWKKEYGTKAAGLSNETINAHGFNKGVYILKIYWNENGTAYEKVNKVVLQ